MPCLLRVRHGCRHVGVHCAAAEGQTHLINRLGYNWPSTLTASSCSIHVMSGCAGKSVCFVPLLPPKEAQTDPTNPLGVQLAHIPPPASVVALAELLAHKPTHPVECIGAPTSLQQHKSLHVVRTAAGALGVGVTEAGWVCFRGCDRDGLPESV